MNSTEKINGIIMAVLLFLITKKGYTQNNTDYF